MEQRWDVFAADIRSGDSEQVTETIDEIEELEERLGMSRSEEVEETGRTVARLQD